MKQDQCRSAYSFLQSQGRARTSREEEALQALLDETLGMCTQSIKQFDQIATRNRREGAGGEHAILAVERLEAYTRTTNALKTFHRTLLALRHTRPIQHTQQPSTEKLAQLAR